jgi:predicted nucleotidyltransferase
MLMPRKPVFPTKLHQDAAEKVREYFTNVPETDTIIVVNSCARGQGVPESDLDFAILVHPETNAAQMNDILAAWLNYSESEPAIATYKKSNAYAHLHLDIIDGKYAPGILEPGEPGDSFEIEIGNQVVYSAPLHDAGPYFEKLQKKWLPYYEESLRAERLVAIQNACTYDLNHIAVLVKRELYFHAFDTLQKAFREYLQALFITHRTYPIAYNKWIKEQIVHWLGKPALYQKILPVLSISNLESDETIRRAEMLFDLLNGMEAY